MIIFPLFVAWFQESNENVFAFFSSTEWKFLFTGLHNSYKFLVCYTKASLQVIKKSLRKAKNYQNCMLKFVLFVCLSIADLDWNIQCVVGYLSSYSLTLTHSYNLSGLWYLHSFQQFFNVTKVNSKSNKWFENYEER